MNSQIWVTILFYVINPCVCFQEKWIYYQYLRNFELLSTYCIYGFNVSRRVSSLSEIADINGNIPLLLDFKTSIESDSLQAFRISEAVPQETDRLLQSEIDLIRFPISLRNEISALNRLHSFVIDLINLDDWDEEDYTKITDLTESISSALEILQDLCNSYNSTLDKSISDHLESMTLSIVSVKNLSESGANMLFEYLNSTIVPFSLMKSICRKKSSLKIKFEQYSSVLSSNHENDTVILVYDEPIEDISNYESSIFFDEFHLRERNLVIALADRNWTVEEDPVFTSLVIACSPRPHPLHSSFVSPIHLVNRTRTTSSLPNPQDDSPSSQQSSSPSSSVSSSLSLGQIEEREQFEYCYVLREYVQFDFHRVILTAAFSFSKALALQDEHLESGVNQIPHSPYLGYEELPSFHELCPSRLRVLSLGLGGGELHGFILRYFPCLGIDSVEIDPIVVATSKQYFGITSCEDHNGTLPATATVLVPSKQAPDLCETATNLSDAHCSLKSEANEPDKDEACRSRLFVQDAHQFVRDAAARGDLQWSFVILDLFDTTMTQWEGNIGNGQSNPDISRDALYGLVEAVRSVTEPEEGLAIFHIHFDSKAQLYKEAIRATFADIFVINSTAADHVIVASRYQGLGVIGATELRSESPSVQEEYGDDWLCADPFGDVAAIEAFGQRHRYNRRLSMSSRYSVRGLYY